MYIVIAMFQKQLKQSYYETKNKRKENTEWEKKWIKIVGNGVAEGGIEEMKMEIG